MLNHSIIILTKDRPSLLPRALASALRSVEEAGEILIVDDASVVPAAHLLKVPAGSPVRILRREVSLGISAARNAGIEASSGGVIFFLDDDDELTPGYVRDVLSGPAERFDYGFSACALVLGPGRARSEKPRFSTGPIPPDAPVRKQLCGTGMGFWIRREVAESVGPFATELTVNEDTDYVCRLIQQGRRAWYSARAGVTVHRHAEDGDLSNITGRVSASQRAQAMLQVCDRFPALTGHLGRSYLRHCAKAGLEEDGTAYIRRQSDFFGRMWLTLYYQSKRFGYRLRGTARRRS
jgi:glycosyltransferase involved in cell wall biosynthesis